MSAALVPGCMRRFAAASICVCSICCACCALGPIDGDLGPIWISAGGGGLGSLGELGIAISAAECGWYMAVDVMLCSVFSSVVADSGVQYPV